MTQTFSRTSSYFQSKGVRCACDLYLPSDVENPPVVIMAHGFAAERTFGLPAFAEHFAGHGMAVFLFDYRCFGESDGEPRNYVSPGRHLKDWQAAVAHVRSIKEVNTERIALWGSSFSGGHVIVTASRDSSISAIVAQVPYVDSITTVQKLGLFYLAQAMPLGARDLFRIITFRDPYYIKVIGNPDEFAVMNTPESYPGYTSIIPEGSTWENRCPGRILLTFPWYRPMTSASRVQCPALIMVAEEDSLMSVEAVEKTASRIPNSTLIKYPFGHFDIYTGEEFKDAVSKQTEFLEKHLK